MQLMNTQVQVFLTATLMLLVSCNFYNGEKGNSAVETTPQIQGSLNAIIHTVFDNSEKLDLAAAFVPFWNDSNFLFISNGLKYSYTELKKVEGEYFSTLKQQRFNFSYQNVAVIDSNNAIANLVGTMTSIQKDGTTQNGNIAETIIFKKISGTWKIVGGHESYSLSNETR